MALDARRRTLALDDVPLPLLERYAIGQCTPEELAELEAWIGDRPERRLFVDRLLGLFASEGDEGDAPLTFTEGEIEHAWGRLAERMAEERDKGRKRAIWMRRAAAGVVCVALAVVLWLVFAR